MPHVSTADLRTEQAEAPGVAEELGGGLQHPLPAGEIVLGVAVEVPTEPGHTAPVLRLQPHIHPRAWDSTVLSTGVPQWHSQPRDPPGIP